MADEMLDCVDVNEILSVMGDWTLRIDVKIIYSLIYVVIFVVGLIGNGLLIGKIRHKLTVANVFLINLAISDLLLCITALPITPVLAFMKRWIFGGALCKFVPLCQTISVLISSYCLCLIAVDRYRSIVTPLKVPFTIMQAQIFMAICWLGAIVVSSPLFLTQELQQIVLFNVTLCGEFCGEYQWPADNRLKLAYGSAILVFQYLIPVSILSFCYWKILQVGEKELYWKVKTDWMTSIKSGSLLTDAQQTHTSVRKKRVMYVLILMVAVFMGSWMPLTIVNILRDIGVKYMDFQMYFKLLNAHCIAMCSVVFNPVLYFWMSKRHRRALKNDMNWLTNVRRQNQMGLLEKFAPSPSIGIMYRKSLERHLLSAKCNPYRRGTLADPTVLAPKERILQEMNSNCFLLVPLLPLYSPMNSTTSTTNESTRSTLMFRQKV
ncbi:G-PROTEIN-RECEP-F1-2 domain-containing protein [Aphelenchoides bicaudatus]|nr:G-PROTEIN-RECEP-F1-2 domain-containing protein [Aphelenchoides bicaudatus]